MKKRGSIVVANLEALTCMKESKTEVIDAGKKRSHKSSNDQSSSAEQRTQSTHHHQSNRLLCREKRTFGARTGQRAMHCDAFIGNPCEP